MTHSVLKPRRAPFFYAAKASIALAAVVGLGGCNYRFGVPDPATEQGEEVLRLWQVSLYIAIALGVLVLGILTYSLIRHRRRNQELPPQTEGKVSLEVIYTVIPFIIVTALFFYGLKVQDTATELTSADAPAVEQPLLIDITAYQWNWRFEYPTDDVTIDSAGTDVLPELVIPVDRRTRFNLIAVDVIHNFSVPGFLTKRDVIPGVRNEIEVTPKRTGTYLGYCAEYCGLYHSQMNFNVRVVPEAEYDAWATNQRTAPRQIAEPEVPTSAALPAPVTTQPQEVAPQ